MIKNDRGNSELIFNEIFQKVSEIAKNKIEK